jgi:hypothetical protein
MKSIFISDGAVDKESELDSWFDKGFIIHDKVRFEKAGDSYAGWLFILTPIQSF